MSYLSVQATSGSTTGDWFVEIYAPWCQHCIALQPVWEELADDLRGSIAVAKVDGSANPLTVARFNVTGYPTLLFLHRGFYYEYSGERSFDKLRQFAVEGWHNVRGSMIPLPTSIWTLFGQQFSQLKTDVISLAKRKPDVVIACGLIGFFAGVVLSSLAFLVFYDNSKPKQRVAVSRPSVERASASTPTADTKKKR